MTAGFLYSNRLILLIKLYLIDTIYIIDKKIRKEEIYLLKNAHINLTQFRKNIIANIPVAVFFFVLFTVIVNLFGTQYALVVSAFTTIFKIKYTRKVYPKELMKIFIMEISLCILAFIASMNIVFCIILNMTIPFLLVFSESTQFNPKGYFTSCMTFIFLQMRPSENMDIVSQTMAVIVSCIFLGIALTYFSYLRNKPVDGFVEAKKGLVSLSKNFEMISEGIINNDIKNEFYNLENKFHQLSYNIKKNSHFANGKSRIYYMFSVLFQRAAYLVSDAEWHKEVIETNQTYVLKDLSEYIKEAEKKLNKKDNTRLIIKAEKLIKKHENLPDGRIRIFFRSFLHIFIIILKISNQYDMEDRVWRKYSLKEEISILKTRLNPKSFEIRFALRLSLVMTISLTLSMILNSSRSYWIVLHAFLLLQPDYEECTKRMINRPIGTIIACFIVFFISPYMGGTVENFIFSFVMLTLMYASNPSTWIQPIYSTSYALVMASMTMKSSTAIELRILYLIVALIIVFIGNRFFFPTSKKSQFKVNMGELFHIHSVYWGFLKRNIYENVGEYISADILTHFHMVYDETSKYISKMKDEKEREKSEKIILILWRMLSELEQMLFIVKTENISVEDCFELYKYSDIISENIYPIKKELSNVFCDIPQLDNRAINYTFKKYLKNSVDLTNLYFGT